MRLFPRLLRAALFAGLLATPTLLASPAFANDASVHGAVEVGPCGGGTQRAACAVGNDANHVLVQTTSSAGVLQDHSFYVAMF